MHRKFWTRRNLQVAPERRLSVHPDEIGVEQDIWDVTLWLIGKFGVSPILLWIERHYTQRGREIARVIVMAASKTPAPLTPAARDAFLALGYKIENTGADTYGYPICDDHPSRHEIMRAYDRIDAALRRWRST